MGGIADLFSRATGAVSQAADDYVVSPLQKLMGTYVPDAGPTELPEDISRYALQSRLDSTYDPIQSFRRSTQPKNLPANIPSYRADERKGGLETLPQARFDARSPLKSDVKYWHTDLKGKSRTAAPEIKQMYAYARLSGAAQKLGLPAIDPQQLAAMVLKEGRPDAGFNAFTPKAKPDLDFRKKLNQYNIPAWQKDFLGMVNYADRVAKKKGIPFDAVWNGTGRSADSGKTGFDYAKDMKAHQQAALHPKNKEFMAFINNAFQEGAKFGLPSVKDKARDTDPYLKSDPQYKYHTPDGRLRKAEGGIIIDDGNPAKQRKLI
jgi:hypothetical protein